MQDPFLLEATASEPLTMEEEVEMQQIWRDDDRKCTFIILARDLLNRSDDEAEDIPPRPLSDESHQDSQSYPTLVEDTLHAMIGDINLFLSEEDEDEADGLRHVNIQEDVGSKSKVILSQAELDLMIAKKSHRHKGLGVELALTMMRYGASALGIRRFFVKIKDTNDSSLRLFRDKLGFKQCAYAECFGEYELECKCESALDMVRQIEDKWRLICVDRGVVSEGSSCLYHAYKCPLSD